MKLSLVGPRGFCAGVARAVETLEAALAMYGPPIYVKHQIIHNEAVICSFEKKGAIFVEDLTAVPEGSYLVYSAHGVSPAVRELAQKRCLIEIDATCGLVTKIHSAVKRFVAKGYQIVLIGHRRHVEVEGILGEAPAGVIVVVENPEEVNTLTLSKDKPLFYVTQTTLSLFETENIAQALLKRYPSAETLPTSSICYATTNRQEALEFAIKTRKPEVVLVVGGKASSNSRRLQELGGRYVSRSYLIQTEQDIEPEFLIGATQIVLTSGASTPEHLVAACVDRLKEMGVSEVDECILKSEEVFFGLPSFPKKKEEKDLRGPHSSFLTTHISQ